jgi:hypothetical protein
MWRESAALPVAMNLCQTQLYNSLATNRRWCRVERNIPAVDSLGNGRQ